MALVKGKGENMGLSSGVLPAPLPLRVQLQAGNGGCLEASYDRSTRNDSSIFEATSD